MLRYGPALAALLYPLALSALHQSGQQFLHAPDTAGRLGAGLLLGVAVALVYGGVPALSLAAILKSGRDVLARRLAHLTFAAPPLFVLIGVLFYMLELPKGDYVAWGIGWLGILGFAAFAAPGKETPAAATWIRTAHGFSAAAIVAIFLVWHLANHLTAAWSLETNKAIMDLLRAWYRSDVIQPIILALFAFQLLSGLRLLWAKIPRDADVYSSIQTATGGYLAVYITSHLIAVFILGRIFLAIDTTFAWASGAPTGLLSDPWNVRLIPHYSLAVLFVISHLAMGARAILLGHGALLASANRLAWIICGIGVAVSLLVTIAQLSVREVVDELSAAKPIAAATTQLSQAFCSTLCRGA